MFKKIFLSAVILLMLCFTGKETAAAGGYFYASIGHNDPLFNFSTACRFKNYGFEFGFGFRGYPNMLDYPCPHEDYTIIKDHYDSLLLGVDLIRYFDLGDNFAVYIGGGAYILGYDTIVRSNATGWIYRQFIDVDSTFTYSGGLQFYGSENCGFGIGYHSVRGYNIQMILRLE